MISMNKLSKLIPKIQLTQKLGTRIRKGIAGLQALASGLVGFLIALFVAAKVGANLNDTTTQTIYNDVMNQFKTWAPLVFLVGFATILIIMYKRASQD